MTDGLRSREALSIPVILWMTLVLPSAKPLPQCCAAGDVDCLAEFARSSITAAVNDYDDEGQAALHVAADKGLTEAISILTGQ